MLAWLTTKTAGAESAPFMQLLSGVPLFTAVGHTNRDGLRRMSASHRGYVETRKLAQSPQQWFNIGRVRVRPLRDTLTRDSYIARFGCDEMFSHSLHHFQVFRCRKIGDMRDVRNLALLQRY